jgi:hypothetical protein
VAFATVDLVFRWYRLMALLALLAAVLAAISQS